MRKKRDAWSSKIGFILAASGSAVGLGNLWKFPYSVGSNGGGAFVVLYLLFLTIIGFPLMLAAISLGRKAQLSAVGAYRSINPKWAFVGKLGVVCGFFILAFYSTVGGWVIFYFIEAIKGSIVTTNSEVLEKLFKTMISSPFHSIFYQFLFMILTLLIVLKGISAGIEKASKIMMPALFFIIILIAIRSVTLEGSLKGIEFFLIPDFSKISFQVVMNALGQMFFSLSIGMGVMVTYGSYLKKDDSLLQTSFSIPLIDTFVAMIAGFATLPAVFAYGFNPQEGPALMFITLPNVFAHMKFGYFFCLLFFTLVLFAALTSSISMLEVCVSYFVDEKSSSRKKSSLFLSLGIFILGIPASLSMGILKNFHIIGSLTVFDFYDKLTSNLFLTIGGLLLSIFVGYVWGADKAIEEMKLNHPNFAFYGLWKFLIKTICPISILIILVVSVKEFFSLI